MSWAGRGRCGHRHLPSPDNKSSKDSASVCHWWGGTGFGEIGVAPTHTLGDFPLRTGGDARGRRRGWPASRLRRAAPHPGAMRGAQAAPLRLLLLVGALLPTTRAQASAGPLQCFRVGPEGNLNCSWERVGDLGGPIVLHLQSQKYHRNRTQLVPVPAGQSWETVSRKVLTSGDQLLVWGTQGGHPLWAPIFVDLETRVKPDAPWLLPSVDFSEDAPLEATVQWQPPKWPPLKALTCEFHYQRCPEQGWLPLEPDLKTMPLSPVEMQELELTSAYSVRGRCRVESERDLWGEWSPALSFQTPPAAPKDVWVSGNACATPGSRAALLVWKAPGPCVQVSYQVSFWTGEKMLMQEGVPCCSWPVPALAHWARVSAEGGVPWEPSTKLSLVCLDSVPQDVVVSSVAGSPGLLVSWRRGTQEPWEYVVAWAPDGKVPEDISWTRLPPGNLSAVLPGNFTRGVPYRITVTAVFPEGLAPAPSAWGFGEELAPVAGPALWRLPDDPLGTPAVAWGEVSRQELRGHLTHYTWCAQSASRPSVCVNVSSSTRTVTLPNLPGGPCKLWVMAATIAGQGPPGPSLQFHLPGSSLSWQVLPRVLCLCALLVLGGCLGLATPGRCLHLKHKVLPRWVLEKVPDPANSHSGRPHIEVSQPQPPPLGDVPILEVEEMEPLPPRELPQASTPLYSGYEKHFMPTPEELGLLRPSSPQMLA
ncbi:PREDICTED: interleukin-27 receptor subunit alpha isoform X2 [Chinchilla lanigera]|uniref:interleukin-27 receptor subunit alpha isoform X2 n=1 Tax=Chinchilla lanigera TaxID=34839 RepID=UPI00038EE4C7|nr:PREDICTED: interleukin-27 receptor subunit alpha isoform X2 [Chinchilla lanigera]